MDIDDLIDLYVNKQKTLQQIADIYGVYRSAIHYHLQRHNVIENNEITPDEHDIIVESLKQGISVKSIADQLSRSSSGLHRYIKVKKLEDIKKKGKLKNKDEKRQSEMNVVKMLKSNIPQKHICEKENISLSTINNIKHKHKIQLRNITPATEIKQKIKKYKHDIVYEFFHEGTSKQYLAKKYGIPLARVADIIKETSRDIPSLRRVSIPIEAWQKLTNQQWLLNCKEQNRTYKDIGEEFNVDPSNVKRYFDFYNITLVECLIDKIPELSNKEWLTNQYKTNSQYEIAEMLNVSPPTVRQALLQNNIEIKREMYVSKQELQLQEYISQITHGEIICNDRSVISPQELDIVIPDKKIAIEYCGLYWHSEKFKSNDYHLTKLESCINKGLRLLTIFEDEWTHNQDLVKRKIAHILGNTQTSQIYARRTSCKTITTKDARNFLNIYHIQGFGVGSIKYGLFNESELVAVMIFKKSKCGTVYDLNRYASSTQVVGGFSKLLKHFMKNNNWEKITTFADLRWSDIHNNVYQTNGFSQVHITKPAYYYYNYKTKRLEHRMNFQKKHLRTKLSNYNPELTERCNANNNGYYAVYDCGHVKYELTKS